MKVMQTEWQANEVFYCNVTLKKVITHGKAILFFFYDEHH